MDISLNKALKLVHAHTINPGLKMTLLTMLDLADENGEVEGSGNHLSRIIGISPRTFDRFTSILSERKLLTIVTQKYPNGMKIHNKYVLNFYLTERHDQ